MGAGHLEGKGGKPMWMRWRTFDRLTAEVVGESLAGMALRFAIKL
jgi:hypothetical protein